MGNFYLGLMNYSNQFARGYFYMRSKEYAAYFQDNFKVTPRLTVNLGIVLVFGAFYFRFLKPL